MEFRRIATIAAALILLTFCAEAQVINVDRVTAREKLTVAGTEVDSITVDSTFSAASARKIPTSGAVKAYVDNNAGGAVFDSDRSVLRVPEPGDNIGGSTVQDFLNFFYFAPPTISLAQSPSTTLIEIGSTQQYTFTATTSNPGSATLSAGHLFVVSGDTLDSYTSTTTGAATIDFTPKQTPVDTFDSATYQLISTQLWSGGGESGTATSNTRTINAVYPVLYGVSATDLHATGNAYTTLTKLVEAEGDKTVTLNGIGFQYYAMPSSWSDTNLSQILDQNDFNVTASFTCQTVSVSSSGLTNNWTLEYEICKSNTSGTVTNADYGFNQ